MKHPTQFTLTAAAPWLLFALASGLCEQRPIQAASPNILFLLSDDHSYPFLSCYGDTHVNTPNLDRLAGRGMRFHRFFTAAPQCVLSRAALMTGKSPVAARMIRFSSPLPRDEITFPEILRSLAGYYTGICGRSHHLDGSKKTDGFEHVFQEHGLRTFHERVDYLRRGKDQEVLLQIQEFLDACPTDQPFFMWANDSDPHHAWNAPDHYRPDPDSLKLPAHWPDLPGMREQVADYCAEVNRVDERIGQVLDLLEKRRLVENTIIVFAGDNGAALPHGKGSLYDPGSNVPLVVAGPTIASGAESSALLSGEDLAPTLLELAGLTAPDSMSGVSFVPLLQGKAERVRPYIFIARGPHGTAPVNVNTTSAPYDLGRAVRSERYKFIYNCTPWTPYSPVDSRQGPAWKPMQQADAQGKLSAGLHATYFEFPRPVYELYDVQQDPSELNNVSGSPELQAVERELRTALAEKMILDFDHLPLPDLMTPASN